MPRCKWKAETEVIMSLRKKKTEVIRWREERKEVGGVKGENWG